MENNETSTSNFIDGVFCECGDQLTIEEINNNKCNNCQKPINL